MLMDYVLNNIDASSVFKGEISKDGQVIGHLYSCNMTKALADNLGAVYTDDIEPCFNVSKYFDGNVTTGYGVAIADNQICSFAPIDGKDADAITQGLNQIIDSYEHTVESLVDRDDMF